MIIDTGVVHLGADEDHADHPACAGVLDADPGPLLVPVPVVAERAWLIERPLGPAGAEQAGGPRRLTGVRCEAALAASAAKKPPSTRRLRRTKSEGRRRRMRSASVWRALVEVAREHPERVAGRRAAVAE